MNLNFDEVNEHHTVGAAVRCKKWVLVETVNGVEKFSIQELIPHH
ncbi:hypothetical protein [Paenibacillus borealis]|nr:hypothetical protein [Paenibacillus borealis]